jgi:hypothetical protein
MAAMSGPIVAQDIELPGNQTALQVHGAFNRGALGDNHGPPCTRMRTVNPHRFL